MNTRHLPNLLGLFRIVATPALYVLIALGTPTGDLSAVVLLLLMAASDIADGRIARKLKVVSPLGVFSRYHLGQNLCCRRAVADGRTRAYSRLGCIDYHYPRICCVGVAFLRRRRGRSDRGAAVGEAETGVYRHGADLVSGRCRSARFARCAGSAADPGVALAPCPRYCPGLDNWFGSGVFLESDAVVATVNVRREARGERVAD